MNKGGIERQGKDHDSVEHQEAACHPVVIEPLHCPSGRAERVEQRIAEEQEREQQQNDPSVNITSVRIRPQCPQKNEVGQRGETQRDDTLVRFDARRREPNESKARGQASRNNPTLEVVELQREFTDRMCDAARAENEQVCEPANPHVRHEIRASGQRELEENHQAEHRSHDQRQSVVRENRMLDVFSRREPFPQPHANGTHGKEASVHEQDSLDVPSKVLRHLFCLSFSLCLSLCICLSECL